MPIEGSIDRNDRMNGMKIMIFARGNIQPSFHNFTSHKKKYYTQKLANGYHQIIEVSG